MGEDLLAGGTFPDLVLPDHAGNQRHLSQLAADDPVLLHFYRGWWCPKEQAYFRNLVGLMVMVTDALVLSPEAADEDLASSSPEPSLADDNSSHPPPRSNMPDSPAVTHVALERLDELGVAHGEIVDAPFGSGLAFRDPDNIALAFFAPPAA